LPKETKQQKFFFLLIILSFGGEDKMKVVITNVMGEYVQQVVNFLENEATEWINLKNVSIEGHEVSFELLSNMDPFPEDRQMQVLTNMFFGSGFEFLIRETGFCWTIA